MAYSYTPKFRLTGPAGPATIYDVSGYSFVTMSSSSDAPLFTSHEMLDMSTQLTRYGTRRTVGLDFEFPTSETTNESTLMATILRYALDDEWLVELSLDSGTTYREVVLASFSVEDLGAKKIGRAVKTAWTVAAMQTSPVSVMGGSW